MFPLEGGKESVPVEWLLVSTQDARRDHLVQVRISVKLVAS